MTLTALSVAASLLCLFAASNVALAADWDEFYTFNPNTRPPYGADVAVVKHTRKVQQALKDIGCYTARVDGWWAGGSRNAYDAVARKNNGIPEDAKASPTEFVNFLKGLPAGYCATSTKYCNIRIAGKKWLNDQGSQNYGDAFETISKIFEGYTDVIKLPPDDKTDWLATTENLDNVQRDFAFHLKQALDLRRKLASTWALVVNPSCKRCILLEAYAPLEKLATRPKTGKPYISEDGKTNILLDTITFRALEQSHSEIKTWIANDDARKEAFDTLLGSTGNSTAPAVAFGVALRAAEKAKSEMLKKIRTAIKSGGAADPLLPTTILEKKSDYCGHMKWEEG